MYAFDVQCQSTVNSEELPGPAIVVIPIGLGILATEFVWAINLLHKIKERLPKRAAK